MLPMLKTAGRSKMPGPGASNSWVCTTLAAKFTRSPLLFLRAVVRSRLLEPDKSHVDAEPGTAKNADCDQEAGPQPAVQQPADQAIDGHTGDDVPESMPGVALRAARLWSRRRILLTHRGRDITSHH